MEPMQLKPAGKNYLWGGERLKTEYGKAIDLTPLAETWECSIHPDGLSTVSGGSYAGQTLAQVLEEHPEYLGSKVRGAEFPILVKLIDAKKNLSIQVHPGDAYAREHEHQNGKTEMWYVLDAQPGAALVCGFKHPMTKELLVNAVKTGTLSKHLQKVPVSKGDVFYIPAGMVHAIGAGVLVAEIQESSNVTYRVYDYERVGTNGKKRELQIDRAIDVLDMRAGTAVRQAPRVTHYFPGSSRELLCRCKYFEAERIGVTKAFNFSVTDTSFQVLLCIEGGGYLTAEQTSRKMPVSKGDCVFLPAGLGTCCLAGASIWMKIRC